MAPDSIRMGAGFRKVHVRTKGWRVAHLVHYAPATGIAGGRPMPFIFRVLGYGGNGLLCFLGLVALFASGSVLPGLFMAGLGGLNLYIIRKIDLYSREEVWLEAEVHKRELRRQIEELDRQGAVGGTAAEPKRIPGRHENEPPPG
jgi:hypothetical protein